MSRPRSQRWSYAELDRHLVLAGYTKRWQKLVALGIPERTYFRWRRDGVPDRAADTVAIRMDSHPALIWTDWSVETDVDVAG